MTLWSPEQRTSGGTPAAQCPDDHEEQNVTDPFRTPRQARLAQGDCPVCGELMHITRLECDNCSTAIEGHFMLHTLSRLPMDHLNFLESFIRNRGVIKDVEVDLGISYPTVKARLEDVVTALGYSSAGNRMRPSQVREERRQILEKLQNKEITSDEAARQLADLGERSAR